MKFTTLALTTLLAGVADAALPSEPPELQTADLPDFTVPSTCGFLYGDPHILTFDNQHADCMSDGDFLMSKSPKSDFQVQSRFIAATPEMQALHFAERGWHVGTGTKAIVVNTGNPNEPVIEVNAEVPKENKSGQTWNRKGEFVGCLLKYYVDGELLELESDTHVGDFQNVHFQRTKAEQKSIWNSNIVTNYYRNFYFKESGVFLQIRKNYWDRFGCFMDARICLPDEIKEQGLYGILGDADGNKANDFKTKFHEQSTPYPGNKQQKQEWCESNWCVKDAGESMFHDPDILDGCQADHGRELDEAVENASEEIKEQCFHDEDCITDTIITGDITVGLETLQSKTLVEEGKNPGGTVTNDPEDGVCRSAEGLPVNCESYESEFVCEAKGYDFGYKMDGCQASSGSFHDLIITDANPTCQVGSDIGSFEMDCNHGTDVTITPSVDTIVKISGSTSGTLYKDLVAGETYTLTTAIGDDKEAIEQIEFCFRCPTAVVDNTIVTCDMDVKTCDDGTQVHRDPDHGCEFPVCPFLEDDTCVELYAKCGGKDYTGPTTCMLGAECVYDNEWWSGCKLKAPEPGTVAKDQKCGGKDYTGPTQCAEGLVCTYDNEWWSGCKLPNSKTCPGFKTVGECKDMQVDLKCPYMHDDRQHRLEGQTLESCHQACADVVGCDYYSFSENGDQNGNFAGVCMGCTSDIAKQTHVGFNLYSVNCLGDKALNDEGTKEYEEPPEEPEAKMAPPTPKASGSGDPHFKTWTGEKFDYHGECDLVLLDNPSFNNGQGLKIHIRTTRVKYFSFIEKVAIQIGDEVLEFDNDAENFLMNGETVGANVKHQKTLLGGFVVRRDPKALSIRLNDHGSSKHNHTVAKIDLHTRKNGFPAVIVDAGHTDEFKGSLGLLGEWGTGKYLARDGVTEIAVEDKMDASAFALEWQVRDTEPMLFKENRFPQFPATCTPAKKHLMNRLGMDVARKEAEEACAHWKEDMEDCIFDVIATRDVLVAEEGHIVHIE